jgi:hypothetical protein
MSQDTKDFFDALFNESGANSKGEFMAILLDRYENPPKSNPIEKIVEVEKPVEVIKTIEVEKLVEVEKQLQANQLLLSLSDAQLFALRETVLSFNDFAERQNEIIDSFAPENKAWFMPRDWYSPEIYQLWGRFEPIGDNMTDGEREMAIKSNISSCLLNSFILLMFKPEINEHINESLITPRIIREYVIVQADPTHLKQ